MDLQRVRDSPSESFGSPILKTGTDIRLIPYIKHNQANTSIRLMNAFAKVLEFRVSELVDI